MSRCLSWFAAILLSIAAPVLTHAHATVRATQEKPATARSIARSGSGFPESLTLGLTGLGLAGLGLIRRKQARD